MKLTVLSHNDIENIHDASLSGTTGRTETGTIWHTTKLMKF